MPLSKQEEDNLETAYSKIILTAKPLSALKSKEAPTVSASTCIHLKAQLKGGGNKSASYITCKLCHSRWESPVTAAEIKEEFKRGKKGLLSQEGKALMTEEPKKKNYQDSTNLARDANDQAIREIRKYMKEAQEERAMRQQDLLAEMNTQKIAMREKEVQMQAMMHAVMKQKEELERLMDKRPQEEQKKTQGAMKLEPGGEPLCHCRVFAIKLRSLMEDRPEERHFWTCRMGQCEFFQWEGTVITLLIRKCSPSHRRRALLWWTRHPALQRNARGGARAQGPVEEAMRPRRKRRRLSSSTATERRHAGAGEEQKSEKGSKKNAGQDPRTLRGRCLLSSRSERRRMGRSRRNSALQEERPVRVKTKMKQKTWAEDVYGFEKETQFNRKQRKFVMKGLTKVSEVFSPPRIAEEAKNQGLSAGTSFDLLTGWNLSDPSRRKEMWRRLKEEDPILLMLCPPCCAFSILQALHYPKMDWEVACFLLLLGVEHLELAMKLAEWQHKRGKYFLFEHPDTAKSWEEENAKKIEELEEVWTTTTDMCMYGMNVSGEEE